MEDKREVPTVQNPLGDIFPGETLTLASGKIVTVRQWSAREVVHDIPAILTRIAMRAVRSGAGLSGEDMVSVVIAHSMDDLLLLLKKTTGLEEEDFDRMTATELMQVVRAMVRQNRSFFAELNELYQEVGVKDLAESVGIKSQPPSSATESA